MVCVRDIFSVCFYILKKYLNLTNRETGRGGYNDDLIA